MNLITKDSYYTWHLSLRVDRPVEGCTIKPHAYMYGKKLDDRDLEKPLPPHSKKCREPPPNHEFSYRWFRGPPVEPCAFEGCPRRTSFSPHEWSIHALGGPACSLQCVSTQSSLYKCIFCNPSCFVSAWKTQHTMAREKGSNGFSTPLHRRDGSFGSSMDDDRSTDGSVVSYGGNQTQRVRRFTTDDTSVFMSPQTDTQRTFSTGYTSFNDYDKEQTDQWIEISRDHLYIPNTDDIGRRLKLEAAAYSTETGELLMLRVVKTDLVLSRAPDPVKRKLVTAKSSGPQGGARFRIATYNVLAEIYATQQQYPHCDFWALSWDYRCQNILREIVEASPDVVCLQEIQADHYENHFYASMSEQGYEGVYKQKTRQSMGLVGKVDGCAIFWRRTKFILVESYSIEFNELAQRQATQVMGLNPRSEECIAFLNRLSKDNVAQLVVLELVQTPMRPNRDHVNQICVTNTHLYSNKDFPDVKLWQTWQLLQELETFILSRGTQLPLLICGDFNSTPDTAVYDLLSRQTVHPGHPDVNIYTDESVPNILPDAINITHSFQMGSSYQTVMGDEPFVTNFTTNFKGVLDYIWYSATNLRPISAAAVPDESILTRNGEALPSTEFSSDHIMLISDMQIIGNSRSQ